MYFTISAMARSIDLTALRSYDPGRHSDHLILADTQIVWSWQTLRSSDPGRHSDHLILADTQIIWSWQTLRSSDPGRHSDHLILADTQIIWSWQTLRSYDPGRHSDHLILVDTQSIWSWQTLGLKLTKSPPNIRHGFITMLLFAEFDLSSVTMLTFIPLSYLI